MKTLLKTFVIAVVLMSSITAYSGSTPYIKLKSYDAKKFSLLVRSFTSTTKITLKDKDGYELYSEQVNVNEGYGKNFDLRSLPNGKYFLELELHEEIIVNSLVILDGELKINPENQNVITKPYIRQVGNSVDVAMLSDNAKLQLSILNTTREVIFEDTFIRSENNVGKRYNMSHLRPGNYTVLVKIDGRNYKQRISIQ